MVQRTVDGRPTAEEADLDVVDNHQEQMKDGSSELARDWLREMSLM